MGLSIILNCFYKELNKITGKARKNSNFVIKNDKNELITDDIDVAKSFNEKFVSISKTLAASIDNVPFTTHGVKTNEKSLFFIQLMALRFRGL